MSGRRFRLFLLLVFMFGLVYPGLRAQIYVQASVNLPTPGSSDEPVTGTCAAYLEPASDYKPGTVGRRQTTPKSPDEVPMAVVGIVPVKVTAENGPIKPGDLLVTSSMPGRAMKGTDRNQLIGAVIGKAMAPLESGTGTIEVLVSLQ